MCHYSKWCAARKHVGMRIMVLLNMPLYPLDHNTFFGYITVFTGMQSTNKTCLFCACLKHHISNFFIYWKESCFSTGQPRGRGLLVVGGVQGSPHRRALRSSRSARFTHGAGRLSRECETWIKPFFQDLPGQQCRPVSRTWLFQLSHPPTRVRS